MRIINKAYLATTTELQYRYIPLSRFWGEQREQKNEERVLYLEHCRHKPQGTLPSVRKGYDVTGCNESVTQETLHCTYRKIVILNHYQFVYIRHDCPSLNSL